MRDAWKGLGALALVTIMLAGTVLAAARAPRMHGARLYGVADGCRTILLPGAEMVTVCGGGR